ncbi:hypothetical protein NV379_09535 [Paenibacillus sp. N1-5-1-14]|uniref:hypothetical protein n=1 Tax=Paenibacillus radicibacter TaxID=2972488 RepID=UPI00215938F3|nr:hypothetical protein [Paenibacillus radicibacter]MCR8642902.1 hypothetical protein [Paenibacillus radicibacter]
MREMNEHGEKHWRERHSGRHHHGAKTFRRGRALEFLNRLRVKRDSLKQQLEQQALQEIKMILLGELKAIELVIDEYTAHFEIQENDEDTNN